MTPGARVQAAIELLDQIIAAAHEGGAAADTLVQRYFATRRYAGSKDRRAVRDLVFAAIRACGEAPATGRAALLLLARDDAALAAAFDGSTHAPAPIAEDEPVALAGSAPAWLVERMQAADLNDNEIAALIGRAPLDVRVNRLRASVDAIAAEIPGATHLEGLHDALRLPTGTDVAPFAGRVEVQDAGSQIVSGAARVEPGMTVIDLCAGAGGKTLALAAAMQNTGRIIAADTDRGRLSKLKPRAEAAEVTIAEPVLLDPGRDRMARRGGCGADRCAMLGHRHLAAQSRGALAAHPRSADAAGRDAAALAAGRRRAGEAGWRAGLCRLLAARRGRRGTGRCVPRASFALACRAAGAVGRARARGRGAAHPGA